MTPQEVITDVRILIQDEDSLLPTRNSDADLLAFVNKAVKMMVQLRPDLFVFEGDETPTVDQVEQVLPSTAVRLMEIHRIKNGDAIQETNKETMDQTYPQWPTDTADTPVNWMRHPRNPTRYYLYPRPASGTILVMEYIDTPDDYTLSDTIALPEAYKSVLVDGTVFLAESIDNESIGSGRAKFYYDAFVEALSSDFNQRVTVDSEGGSVGQGMQRPRQQGAQG